MLTLRHREEVPQGEYICEEYHARDYDDPKDAAKAAESRQIVLKRERRLCTRLRTELRTSGLVYILEATKEGRDLIIRPIYWHQNIQRIRPDRG
jgi:hypothetical protein